MAGRIDISRLSFSYTNDPGKPVFSNVSFALAKGTVFCLLGPNGSGKSTLLKCVAGLFRPLAGRVRMDGTDLHTLPPKQIARHLGFVPQSLVSAFPFTVADIVVMGRAAGISLISSPSGADRRAAEQAMERIGISHLAARPCNRLSGGEWQMVLIARALTQSPGVLLLDEPTSHLDLGNQIRILETIDSLAGDGITILMASHFPDHAFLLADRAGILRKGRLAPLGEPDKILTETELAAAYDAPVRVVRPFAGSDRKICVPDLPDNRQKRKRLVP